MCMPSYIVLECITSYIDILTKTILVLVHFCFPLVSVEDSNAVESAKILLLPNDKAVINWSPDSIVPLYFEDTFAVSTDYNVDIYLYRLDLMSENYTKIERIASNIPNTGMYEITLPLVNLQDSFAASLIGISLSKQFASRSTRNALSNTVLSLLTRASKFGLIYVGGSLASRALCAAWLLTEPDDIGEMILDRLPPCPPVQNAALNDPVFTEENFLLSFFHPGASSCFRQVQFTR